MQYAICNMHMHLNNKVKFIKLKLNGLYVLNGRGLQKKKKQPAVQPYKRSKNRITHFYF